MIWSLDIVEINGSTIPFEEDSIILDSRNILLNAIVPLANRTNKLKKDTDTYLRE